MQSHKYKMTRMPSEGKDQEVTQLYPLVDTKYILPSTKEAASNLLSWLDILLALSLYLVFSYILSININNLFFVIQVNMDLVLQSDHLYYELQIHITLKNINKKSVLCYIMFYYIIYFSFVHKHKLSIFLVI